MKALLKVSLFFITILASSTAFGQDTVKITPPFRYIEKGDTFTVFKIKDERAIAFMLKQGEYCQDEIALADSTIKTADRMIDGKDKEVVLLNQQKQNLTEQVSIKTKIVDTYAAEVSEKQKQISVLKKQNLIYKITSGILAITTLYFIVK